jgi:endogenous inhibitor of DNA gyrase (YacG/DUF329 family)
MTHTAVTCPVCGVRVTRDPGGLRHPFCSERCRMIDLGDWASDRHVIPGRDDTAEDESPPSPRSD